MLALLPVVAWADDSGTCGENLTWTYEDATKTLEISGTGEMEDFYDDGYQPWFNFRSYIKIIIINDGITSIGMGAFTDCTSLVSASIPNSVSSIGSGAFSNCYDLTSIEIPNSVTSIKEWTFSYCRSLTSIEIPNSVTSIGNGAFRDCSNLSAISVPQSVVTIGGDAFNRTSWYNNQPDGLVYAGLIAYRYKGTMPDNTSIILKSGTRGITGDAFYGCSGLTSITIPSSVTSIGSSAFYGCSGLTSITIPEGVTSIEYRAFYGCSGLTSITIPSSVTTIGSGAFDGCWGLASITIPSSVTTIEYRAFYGCWGLAAIIIPSSVTTIGDGAFDGCYKITDVYCYAETVPATNLNAFDVTYIDNSTLHVPASAIEAYKTIEPWSKFGTIVTLDGEEPVVPEPEQCAKPNITFANGKVRFDCETENVKFVPTVTCEPSQTLNGNELELGTTFTISVYAKRSGYEDSEVATATINLASIGDVNGDGQITIADVTSLVNIILGK